MARAPKGSIISDAYLKRLALLIAVNCVRNTVIEDYHARGSLSQEDMKKFNKEVANKLYTFIRFMFKGTEEEKRALLEAMGLMYPNEWDKPVIDASIRRAVKLMLKSNTESDGWRGLNRAL